MCAVIVFFFFFKQKTAYEMRISDWSSDVCSSDLGGAEQRTRRGARHDRGDVAHNGSTSIGTTSARSALDDVDGEATERGLLVLRVHIGSCFPHRLDHLVQRYDVRAIAPQGDAGGRDRLDRTDGVPRDAGHLDQPTNHS